MQSLCKKKKLSESEFQIVLENLDVDQITPILLKSELLSPQDHEKLVKKPGKPAVRTIINKAKEHAEGAKLFQNALEETREYKGHQKILSVLFTADSSESQKKGVAENNNISYQSNTSSSKALTLSSDKSVEISVTALNIYVHFIYGAAAPFPRRIITATITELYNKVMSTLENKIPGSKPSNIQFQCGTKWYELTEGTDFDSLCLNEDNPEITIRANPIPFVYSSPAGESSKGLSSASESSKGLFLAGESSKELSSASESSKELSSAGENSKELSSASESSKGLFLAGESSKELSSASSTRLPTAGESSKELSSGESSKGLSTGESTKDIVDKNVLKSMVDKAESFLQRSLAIMIKSAMSRLYGNKETLQKLHELKNEVPNNSKAKVDYDTTIRESCKLWDPQLSKDQDWIYHCRRILPYDKRKGGPDVQWKDLCEELSVWRLDMCLKLIERAKLCLYVKCKHAKCVEECKCAEHLLFSSEYMCFNVEQNKRYNFVALAKGASNARNFNAHSPTYEETALHIEKHFEIIEQLANELVEWVTHEDKIPQNINCCQDGLDNIKMRRKGCFYKYVAKWNSVLNSFKNFNVIDFGYILVSTPCKSFVSKEELTQLSRIPWAAIVDFDVTSRDEGGLLHSFCEPDGRLRVSCQSSSKNTVVQFSYNNISGVGNRELCRDGHVPWIFPYGLCKNDSVIEYPCSTSDEHIDEVQTPVIEAMRKIAIHVKQNNKSAVSVVLCYGEYAHKNNNLPYFLSDLKCLCDVLRRAGGNIIILSDSIFLTEHLKPLPVHIFPLDTLCCMVQKELNFGQDELQSINMPGPGGNLQPITFKEENFELIHEYIAEHEFLELRVKKIIKLRQQGKELSVSDTEFKTYMLYELREKFYKGEKVTWNSLKEHHAIDRQEEKEIRDCIEKMLQDHASEMVGLGIYTIYHVGRAGATTLAKKILWDLKHKFPCVILKDNCDGSMERAKHISNLLKELYEKLRNPILMLIDQEPAFRAIRHLTQCVCAKQIPIVFLQVQRYGQNPADKEQVNDSSEHYILPSVLSKIDANNLKHKFFMAFGKDKMDGGDRNIAKLESSMLEPIVDDKVFVLAQNGVLREVVKHVKNGLQWYYIVSVEWENNDIETCIVGPSVNTTEHRLVYLKKANEEINRLYQTFQFYGIMYLDEEFREPMCKHIKNRLDIMGKNEIAKEKLLILAYLSLLFAFKACESIHEKAFEHLCYAVTKTKKTKIFDLRNFIPSSANEFIIITKCQLQMIHPIVAYQIIEVCGSALSFPYVIPPLFVRGFLDYMLPESEYQNEKATLAINRLLTYRESIFRRGYLTTKPFSELILALNDQKKEHGREVLEYASELTKNCHCYGHCARYVSKIMNEYDEALEILKEAYNLADGYYEESLILNIEGDIFRERLHKCLNHNLDWKDDEAFAFHLNSCQGYRKAYKKNHDKIPLFNEITVRLDLLEAIKKRCKISKIEFFEFLHSLPDKEIYMEVFGSTDVCTQLVEHLEEHVQAAEEKKSTAHLKSLRSRLLFIEGSNFKKRKKILRDLMTKYATHVYLPYTRRSYVSVCRESKSSTPEELQYCLDILKDNFDQVGYVDKDMIKWLSIKRQMSDVGSDSKIIEDNLLLWKYKGPCIVADKRAILTHNEPIWANFYLSIFYFIQLIETKEENVSRVAQEFNKYYNGMRQEKNDDKGWFKIREWLYHGGVGFGHLISKQPNEMLLLLTGSVEQSHSQQLICWKKIYIPFDSRKYSFSQGQQVNFGVGFTFHGPQAIPLDST